MHMTSWKYVDTEHTSKIFTDNVFYSFSKTFTRKKDLRVVFHSVYKRYI